MSHVHALPALVLIAAITWQSVVLLVVTMAGVLLTTHLVRTRLFPDKGKQRKTPASGRTWSSVKRDAVATANRRRQPAGGRKKAKKK